MKNRKLVIASDNEFKVDEIRQILKDLPIEVLSKKDIGLSNLEVEEDGDTFEENSLKKAKALAEKVNYMVMADDSGLVVEALNGEPGVYSSRYAGEEGNSEKNIQKLLDNMKDIPWEERKASFIAAITLITEDKEIFTVKGECKGHIAFEPRYGYNFGYNPIFVPEGFTQTFAELGEEEKNAISHRGRAVSAMKKVLKDILGVELV